MITEKKEILNFVTYPKGKFNSNEKKFIEKFWIEKLNKIKKEINEEISYKELIYCYIYDKEPGYCKICWKRTKLKFKYGYNKYCNFNCSKQDIDISINSVIKWIEKKYNVKWNEVENYIEEKWIIIKNKEDIFSQKIFIYNNKLEKIPNCKICWTELEFKSYKTGYWEYCSSKCASNDKELSIQKVKKKKKRRIIN